MNRRAFLFGSAALPIAASLPAPAAEIVETGIVPSTFETYGAATTSSPVSVLRSGPNTFIIEVAGGSSHIDATRYVFEGRLEVGGKTGWHQLKAEPIRRQPRA